MHTIDFGADWVRQSIDWHARNGTIARPSAAYDSKTGLAKDQTMPSNMQPSSGVPRGYVNARGDYRTSRDQAPPSPMSQPGSFTQNLDQGEEDPDDNGLSATTGAELYNLMMICRAGLSLNEQQNFDMLNRMSHNGNGPTNGDRGMRRGNRTHQGDRRPAQDSAVRASVAAVNRSDFLRRYPMAKGIRLSASWRD